METFENFLDNFNLPSSSFSLHTREEVLDFIENNSLSKILEFWRIFPEGMIEEHFKEKISSYSFTKDSDDNIYEKDIFALIDNPSAWFIAENLLKDEKFFKNFQYFYYRIFLNFEEIWLNEKKIHSNLSYYLSNKGDSENNYFKYVFSDILINTEFIKEKLIIFIEKNLAPNVANLIYFIEGNYHCFFKDTISESILNEFNEIINIDFFSHENRYIIHFFGETPDFKKAMLQKILDCGQYDLLLRSFNKLNDELFNQCLNHSYKNLNEDLVSFIMDNIDDKKISKSKFFEFLPYMKSPYLNNIENSSFFSNEEMDKILSKFSSSDIVNHMWNTNFENQLKKYIAQADKQHIFSIIKKESISLSLFPDDYFLDLDALKNFHFSSEYSIYNQKNFDKLKNIYGYENLLDNYHFFDFWDEKDKKNVSLVLKLINGFPNISFNRIEFINKISLEVLEKDHVQDVLFEKEHFDFINFKSLKNQLKLLKYFKKSNDYEIKNLKKYLKEDLKIFLEIHVKEPTMYYDFFINYLENEYIKKSMKINKDDKRKQGPKL